MSARITIKEILIHGALMLATPFFCATAIAQTSVQVNCNDPTQDLHAVIATANAATGSAAPYTINISGNCLATAGASGTFTINAPMTLRQDPTVAAVAVLDGGNALPVINVAETAAGTVLDGLTIQNGLGFGGGISNSATGNGLSISNSTIQNNKGNGNPGAGMVNRGVVTITKSNFLGNTTAGANGGGLAAFGGVVNIFQSTFSGNKADRGGALVSQNSGVVITIIGSTLSGNTAPSSGGAIDFIGGGSAVISQSTISGNAGASLNPGGVAGIDGTNASVTISQSIIANNTGGTRGNYYPVANFNIDAASMLVTDADAVANLGALADNGGPTMTMKPGPGSLALYANNSSLPGAISVVNGICSAPANLATAPTVDQRDTPRPGVGINNATKTGCDVGAYETGKPRLSLIIPSNGTLNFGPVVQGNSLTLLSQAQNTGNEALLISDAFTVPVAPSVVSKFVLAAPPVFPVNLPIQQVQDLSVQYTPTAGTTDTATLNIRSTDTSNNLLTPVVVNLTGSGSGYVLPPIQQITDILTFMKNNYPANLNGIGNRLLAKVSFDLFVVGVKVSGTLIGAGKTQLACVALKDLSLLTDGKPKPPDIITGSAAPQLYAKIETLRATLGCTP